MKKQIKFKCEGCEKIKRGKKQPFEVLKVNSKDEKPYSLFFCSHECFKDYIKFYLKAIGYTIIKKGVKK